MVASAGGAARYRRGFRSRRPELITGRVATGTGLNSPADAVPALHLPGWPSRTAVADLVAAAGPEGLR